MEILSVLKDITVAGAAIYAAYRAGSGINLWKQQLRGQTDFDVARQILERLIVVKKAFWIAREPLILAHEFGPEFRGLLSQDPAYWTDQLTGYTHVYGARWSQLRDAWVELEGQSVKAEALWGDEVDGLVQGLRACINRINTAMDAHLSNLRDRGTTFQQDQDFARTVRAELHGRYSSAGEYEAGSLSAQFHAAYQAFESFCRDKLSV
jgi:hypothetical protein